MSTSTPNSDSAAHRDRETPHSPYRRDNWWGKEDRDDQLTTGHAELAGTDRYEWVAKKILMDAGQTERLDPEALLMEPGEDIPEEWCFHEHEGEVVRLTNPLTFAPKYHTRSDGTDVEYRQEMDERRLSEQSGREFQSGPIEDRPTPEFLARVEDALDVAALPPSSEREVLRRAERLKRHRDDLHDTQIMSRVLRWIEDPNRIDG